MPKLLWVALPLLIAATLLALQALLRRRAPSRQALNIWSSLLLTGYVSTTAGLGIFWMANQQLPPHSRSAAGWTRCSAHAARARDAATGPAARAASPQ